MNEKEKEWKEVFDLFDFKKKGSLSTEDICIVMRKLGANPSEKDLQEIFNEVDKDRSGKIDFNEFLDLFIKKIKDSDMEDDLIEAFKIFDKDENGIINAKELKDVMDMLGGGVELSEKEANEFINEADTDGDGYINYYEFLNIMMNK